MRLVILFTLQDCPICLFEARYWSLVSEELKDKIITVGITIPNKNVLDFVNEYNLKFKIYQGKDLFSKVCALIKKHRIACITPLKIFINSDNYVIAIEGGTKEEVKQRLFRERVYSIFGLSQIWGRGK